MEPTPGNDILEGVVARSAAEAQAGGLWSGNTLGNLGRGQYPAPTELDIHGVGFTTNMSLLTELGAVGDEVKLNTLDGR